MRTLLTGQEAFGWPGIPARWTRGDKEGVGTAYHSASLVWFTLSQGILNEIYFPKVDSPQVRDLQFLVGDGETFLHEEKRDLLHTVDLLDPNALGYRVTSTDPDGRYRIVKEIIADPHLSAVLIRTTVKANRAVLKKLRLFVLLAPHLEGRGAGNSAAKATVAGKELLVAFRDQTCLALGATIPFIRSSCGYVGVSDGWMDLKDNLRMDWTFDFARDGNVAMMGELDLSVSRSFTLGVAFGFGFHAATTTLLQALGIPFSEHRQRFQEQWRRIYCQTVPINKVSEDGGRLCRISHNLLLAHEDKTYPGALIASLSIPWGEEQGDEEGIGGYHLVWTRDLCQSAMALLASGNAATPYSALIYLAASQQPDGGFHQNFWIDGQPHWRGIQLDEVAFPILFAWQVENFGAMREFDPYPMILRAAHYLIRQGPATPQERWEESSGFSPSTLAVNIAALICAADFARRREDPETAAFLEDYADFLESHVESWTVTTEGSLVPGISTHYIRIHPVDLSDPEATENPNQGTLALHNQPPGALIHYRAKDIVDGGFLELVRYGIRKASDPIIVDSVAVVDKILGVETPFGPCWHRYNHDGYGQRPDGGAYLGWGKGRAWPLLTGERGHYELSAGRSVRHLIQAMELFASSGGMLPEQVWDEPDRPEKGMFLGRPTGSAMPLMWAHAEYIKLLWSASQGKVFDQPAPVAERYLNRKGRKDLEIWKFNRQVQTVRKGQTLRIQSPTLFRLHWTSDEWKTVHMEDSVTTAIGIHYRDLPVSKSQKSPIRFTFFWPEINRWEGHDFCVSVVRDGFS